MKSLSRILALVLSCVLLSCCGKVGDIRLTSWKVASFSPVGLRGLDIAVDLGIDNPSIQFTVSDIKGELFRNGTSVCTFQGSEPVLIKGKTAGTYRLDGNIALSNGVSIMNVMAYAAKFDIEEYSVTYGADVKIKGGLHTRLEKTKVPLKELVKD